MQVGGSAVIYGNVEIYDDAEIYENAKVYGDAIIHGNAQVFGHAEIYGQVEICGNASVFGNAKIYCYVIICGEAKIKDDSDYIIFKNWWSSGRFFAWTRSNNMWSVGCFYGNGKGLIEKAYKDSERSGKEYERIVNYVETILKEN